MGSLLIAVIYLIFIAYCAGEATCFLWTPSYFAGTKSGLSEETIASFGSLIFFGLMLGRVIAGFVSNCLGDRLLIRIGIAIMPFYLLLFAAVNIGLLELSYQIIKKSKSNV